MPENSDSLNAPPVDWGNLEKTIKKNKGKGVGYIQTVISSSGAEELDEPTSKLMLIEVKTNFTFNILRDIKYYDGVVTPDGKVNPYPENTKMRRSQYAGLGEVCSLSRVGSSAVFSSRCVIKETDDVDKISRIFLELAGNVVKMAKDAVTALTVDLARLQVPPELGTAPDTRIAMEIGRAHTPVALEISGGVPMRTHVFDL